MWNITLPVLVGSLIDGSEPLYPQMVLYGCKGRHRITSAQSEQVIVLVIISHKYHTIILLVSRVTCVIVRAREVTHTLTDGEERSPAACLGFYQFTTM